MNLASIVGLFLGLLTTVFGITFVMSTGSFDFTLLYNFWDIPSLLIVFGGTLTTTMIMEANVNSYFKKLAAIKLIFKSIVSNEVETIKTIIALSNVARKEGLLALEEAANEIEDTFLKKGILLIVDGTDPDLVRSILETELSCIEDRHRSVIGFWDKLGSMGPAWGMIGTLIGLINMLQVLNDPSAIGPSMAVALVTTFYGSIIANLFCIPVVNKLRAFNDAEIMIKEITVEGLLSIQAGENPRVIEEKLKSFLKPNTKPVNDAEQELERGEVNV